MGNVDINNYIYKNSEKWFNESLIQTTLEFQQNKDLIIVLLFYNNNIFHMAIIKFL